MSDAAYDHLVWLVCPYMLGRDDKPCMRCPETETWGKHKGVKRGCRFAAEEVVNIVQTGNPWRKPADEVAGTEWEQPA